MGIIKSDTTTISANDLASTMKKLLKEYGSEVNEVCREVAQGVGKDTTKMLRSTSPVKTGKYAKGWTLKPMRVSAMITEYVVYNKAKPSLTHLLEKGHGGKSVAGARPHIQPAEEFAITELENRIREELEQ